ncbi:asparagine synthase (glutamine-hydrolyzing) [Kordiimonas sp. SCSIO 12610]|uniref:asparagine synthase (glutamine-hydrolyzing) n=1 Tax=Kordiimonas sp. SCSIO 12610 TaxID=2829597 RepID=UPI00210A225A|nr:asparagine synthase (glutamine-hydrolyzing) [Kordiimonas sp. SCSIO 12610]UTW54147.1 asparagine synthase (glutamine-hydrolyzing) [Kordiimonas sp. SCSIO 12610]
MCGIAGIINLSGVQSSDHKTVKAMADALTHRGPDGEGFYQDKFSTLGHRRLSVIDVEAGQQPMLDASGRYVIIFNGEIYNHQNLREDLIDCGYVFKTQSDTEVLLYAYIEWGRECLHKLNGMFAFVVWDTEEQSLFAARDRLGIKPFYYAEVDGDNGSKSFVFASEFNALLCHQGITRDIRPDALEDYLALGYVPDPKTIIEGTSKLLPGHSLVFSKQSKEVRIERYWNPVDFLKEGTKSNTGIFERIERAVKRRMIADVPLGAFLSGGVDSSIIVGVMSANSTKPIKASTIGSNDPRFDEANHARDIAKHFGLKHEVKTINSLHGDVLDKIIDHFGEPFADHSAAPTYDVSKLAREKVTVSLSGDGADELLGGYRRYRMHLLEEQSRRLIPLWLRRPVFGFLGRVYPKLDRWPRFLRAKSTFESLAKTDIEAYFNSVSKCADRDRLGLYTPAMKTALNGYHPVQTFQKITDQVNIDDPFRRVQMIDLLTYLPGDILTKLDRASMACSLEARVPFLDHEFVEWTLGQKSHSFFNKGKGKAPLRGVLDRLGIADIFKRPKQGFVLPVADLLRTDLLAEVKDLATSDVLKATGLIDLSVVETYVSEHLAKKKDHQQILWSLLILERSLMRLQVS